MSDWEWPPVPTDYETHRAPVPSRISEPKHDGWRHPRPSFVERHHDAIVGVGVLLALAVVVAALYVARALGADWR